MVKAKVPKVFKCKQMEINEKPDNLVLRYRNLSKQQVKELRKDLDDYCKGYFADLQAKKE
jgi:ribosomal protein L10